ncbi:sigma-70 family RNA polymerase sigma factor [Actinomadura bangladeshensis]|uniref:Sigma-70 family RNA polymerase sigma factor n=1 Tax=Actinomadura bangladeshensis TaxID=453573 RepID=A0A4R4PE49_9ACTN|nr:sigma-70 family RNA polymerase sigma factor [Actinomadura bangladeshensis]TDC19727.1 sigma-70 family RNA polymerase sigma factor [Actinomadura bangladeshensis]
MDDEQLAERFEANRPRLAGLAYRMLGSPTEAHDAVQEAWLRLSRTNADRIENLNGWLTTIVAHICIDMLRSRTSRREDPLDERLPEPLISQDGSDPEEQALLADAVGVAMLVVLDTLTPAERLAFVLHDLFQMPFDEIARILDRSSTATRQLASRARRRVRAAPVPDPDMSRQRAVVDAFLTASKNGDLEALVATLAPDIVLRAEAEGEFLHLRGARTIAQRAIAFSFRAEFARPALINGTAGLVVATEDEPIAVMAFTVVNDKIAELDIYADPSRLATLDPPLFDVP